MALPDMIVRLGLDNKEFLDGLRGTRDEISKVSKELGGMKAVGERMQELGSSLSVGLTLPLGALGVAALSAQSDLHALHSSMRAVSSSAEEAGRLLRVVKEAAKLPGLTFKDAAEGAVRLRTAGMTIEGVDRVLRAFGNALAIVGRGGADLNAVTVQLVQMAGKSKVVAGDLKPIVERVPQVTRALLELYGTVDTERLQKMGVAPAEFIEVILGHLEKLPPAANTVRNEFENARDSITLALADIGAAIAPVAVAVLRTLVPAVTALAGAFGGLPQWMQTAAVGLGIFAAAAGPLIFALGQILAIVPVVTAGWIALKGAITAGAFLAALGATKVALGGIAVALLAALAPVALFAAKAAAVGMVISAAAEAVAVLSSRLGGPKFFAPLTALTNGIGRLIDRFRGGKKAAEDLEKPLDDAAKATTEAGRAALFTIKPTEDLAVQQAEAAAAARRAADEAAKLRAEYVQQRTAALMADTTFRAIVMSIRDKGDAFRRTTDWIVAYRARMMEGRDATWAMDQAVTSFEAALARASQGMNDLSALSAPGFMSAAADMKKAGDDLGEAWKTLGLPSPSETEQKKAGAVAAYETIKNSGTASAAEIAAAYQAMQEALGAALGDEARPASLAGQATQAFTRVSTAITNSAQRMVGVLIGTEPGSVMDALRELGRGIVSALVEPWMGALEDLIEKGLKKLISWLVAETGVMGALGSVGQKLGGILGAGGGAAGQAGGAAAGAVGAAGKAAGAATGAIGQAGGMLAGVTGGLISGGMAMVGSIIGARMMSTDLGRIEENTRYAAIGILGDQGVIGLLWGNSEHWWKGRELLTDIKSYLGWTWEKFDVISTAAYDRLGEVRDRVVELPGRIAAAMEPPPRPLQITVEGNVIGNDDFLNYMAREIGRRLAAQGA